MTSRPPASSPLDGSCPHFSTDGGRLWQTFSPEEFRRLDEKKKKKKMNRCAFYLVEFTREQEGNDILLGTRWEATDLSSPQGRRWLSAIDQNAWDAEDNSTGGMLWCLSKGCATGGRFGWR